MMIDPEKVPPQESYKLLIGGVVPRPIALVSTVSAAGDPNLAPFSFFTAVASSPPTICFAPGRRSSDGGKKDTLINIEATGEFVVNVVTEAMGTAMNEAATDYPPGTNEFEVAGLTPAPSTIVKPPRVRESPINMECRVHQIVHVGPDGLGGASLVIGRIVMFHIADGLFRDGRVDIQALRPLGRLAGSDYTTLGRIVSMRRKPYQPRGS